MRAEIIIMGSVVKSQQSEESSTSNSAGWLFGKICMY